MPKSATAWDSSAALDSLAQAEQSGSITASAAENIRQWLTLPKYSDYAEEVGQHITAGKWKILDDVFWTTIPFGTGGRRGRMYPIGSNAINQRTIGESAQGLINYLKSVNPAGPWSCAIAYDTRHRSREFAELCAGIMVAAGATVYFIDDFRSTPQLSFTIRYKQCDCGIMVTASHNPPSDNAVKIYWSNGAQLVPPHDRNVIEQVNQVEQIVVADFAQSINDRKIILCREETDQALLACHMKLRNNGPRDLKIIYSPLHGVGEFNVRSLLIGDGFNDLEIYQPHQEPDGNFPNVPGHVSNPENPKVFDAMIERAQEIGAELILATDPDCDRMGAACPVELDSAGPWRTLNGNQLSSLLADFVLRQRRQSGTLTTNHYIVTTLVTTPMLSRIAQAFEVHCYDQNLVGFKWICNLMDQKGPAEFVYGTEESHGFLIGDYCRDKDGAIACMLMCELAAEAKAEGLSVHQQMDKLYLQYGLHLERLLTIQMEGSDGMKRMQRLMEQLRNHPPEQLGEFRITATKDYLSGRRTPLPGKPESIQGPTDNLIILETEQPGNYIAIRPSGTEPKVKFYMFAFLSPEKISDLKIDHETITARLGGFERDLKKFAAAI